LREDNRRLLNLIKETKEFKEFSGDAPVDEIPDRAYSLAHDFRQKHGQELSLNLVNTLLSDLNKIWRERERKTILKIKN
jgi:hypothetical protein